ncbi:MAG: hypothetical protein JSS99_11420 [Actinobacteria bacterium]|nr:hypothetical protein [Actinomycetota bacterium]
MAFAAQMADAAHAAEEPGSELVRIRERQRLGMELHETVAQTLFAIGAEAHAALDGDDVAAYQRAMRSIRALAGDGRRDLHATLARLNRVPPSLSLPALLDEEVRAFRAATGIEARFACSGDPEPLGDFRERLLLDTLVEALRNVRKHVIDRGGRPTLVAASLRYRDAFVDLSVQNDGVERMPPGGGRAGGRGCLDLLAERAGQLRGELEVQLAAESGSTVRVRLPRWGSRRVRRTTL